MPWYFKVQILNLHANGSDSTNNLGTHIEIS